MVGDGTRELEMGDRKEGESPLIDYQVHVATGFSRRECWSMKKRYGVRKEG